MTLLVLFITLALLVSFLCSIAEAVILSVSPGHVRILEEQGKASGQLLARLRGDINKPLSAILTLNTIAHTVGAVGAGAQATAVFGNEWVGLFSALMTLAILVFSEIIPKTLGAVYWRSLARITAHALHWLVLALYPFVKMAEWLTSGIGSAHDLQGVSRDEFAALADLGESEGQLAPRESRVLKNLILLRETRVTDAMTPSTVLFSLPDSLTVNEYYEKYFDSRFSRIPVYSDDKHHLTGFVLKDDLMLAQARGNSGKTLDTYRRDLPALSNLTSLADAFEQVLGQRAHIMMIVDEYGSLKGIITMEDIFETLLDVEIMDESDRHQDMQEVAKRLWRKRAERMGISIPDSDKPA